MQSVAIVVLGLAGLALGYTRRGQADSRLPGPKGNREIFLWLSPGASTRDRGRGLAGAGGW